MVCLLLLAFGYKNCILFVVLSQFSTDFMQSLVYHWSWERIDKRLPTQFPYSRSFFHHIIQRGGVKIWSKVLKKSYLLRDGDEIIIDDITRYLSSEILQEAPDIDLEIILEQDDFLVLYKPKGVLSHPTSVWEVWQASVVGFLYHRYKNIPSVGNFIRAGLIHRLDKATDGLMIVAKTEQWLAHFKSLFQAKSSAQDISFKEQVPLKKYYRATCVLTQEWHTFLSSLDQLPYYIEKVVYAKVPHSVPKIGITKILWYTIHDNYVTLDLEILTGRTHQIRYHLSSLGLPIVGDYLYNLSVNNDDAMLLSAYRLVFADINWHMCDIQK